MFKFWFKKYEYWKSMDRIRVSWAQKQLSDWTWRFWTSWNHPLSMCETKVSSKKVFAIGSMLHGPCTKTIAFRFKKLLQVNLSKILSIDITLENLLAGYYRYSNANNNDATLLKALEVSSIPWATYTVYDIPQFADRSWGPDLKSNDNVSSTNK